MIAFLASALVVMVGCYLVVLGGTALFAPARVQRFLAGFAATAARHYAELLVRLVVGGAFVIHAPRMIFGTAFALFGWVLIGTTIGLALLPWRRHRRLAEQVVPRAMRRLPWLGWGALLLGAAVLAAAGWGTAG